MIDQQLKQILLDAQEDLIKEIKDASTKKSKHITGPEMIEDAANKAVFEVYKSFMIITPDAKYGPINDIDSLIDFCAGNDYFSLDNSSTWFRSLGYLFYNYLENMLYKEYFHRDTAHSESYMRVEFNKLVKEVQKRIYENSSTLTTLDDD